MEKDQIRTSGTVIRVPDKGRVVKFRLSDDSLDRVGTRIKASGIETEAYDANPVFLWAHDSGGFFSTPSVESVIGRTVGHSVSRVSKNEATEAFDIDVEFAPEDVNPKAEVAFRLVKKGFLNAVSIGFKPREYQRIREEVNGKEREVIVFTRSELLEASLVPVPANPNAVALARSIVSGYGDPQALPSADADVIARWVVEGLDISGEATQRDRDVEPDPSENIAGRVRSLVATRRENAQGVVDAVRKIRGA